MIDRPKYGSRSLVRRLGPVPAVFVVALLATPAQSATFEITGRGFGHGIGMSQWGAYGQAKQGSNYQQILAHYYTGTGVENRAESAQNVRVLLKTSRSVVVGSISTIDGKTSLDPNARYKLRRKGATVQLTQIGGGVRSEFSGRVELEGAGRGFVLYGRAQNGVSNGRYRGRLLVASLGSGQLQAIDVVAMDDYLKGVVPMESPASWPDQALSAQAVAARSYALATRKSGGEFDQYADTRSQVYGGRSVEKQSTNRAVDETSKQIVTYQGKVATTYFFSSSGGRTENVEAAWPGAKPSPYLVSVDDPQDSSAPFHSWGPLRLNSSSLASKLRSLVKGRLRDIKVVERGISDRVIEAKVVGTRGESSVEGPKLRTLLGLRSTWFRIKKT